MTFPALVLAPSLAPITLNLIRIVQEATACPIGDSGAPPGVDPRTTVYGFFSRLDTAWSGSMLSDFEMATVVYELQCVAPTPAGVELLEGWAQTVLAAAPKFAGWHVIDWEPLGSPGGIRPNRDVSPHLYFATPRWRLMAQMKET